MDEDFGGSVRILSMRDVPFDSVAQLRLPALRERLVCNFMVGGLFSNLVFGGVLFVLLHYGMREV